MISFLHTADWQLGMTRHFLDVDAQARFGAARIEVIRRIGALAVERGCPFVVVGGDVFETNQVERQVVVRALEAMAEAPSVTFHLLPGNHDPLDVSSVFRSRTFTTNQPANVVVLDGVEPVAAAPGVELIVAPWPTKRPLTDLVGQAVATLPGTGPIRIVVGHGAVDLGAPDPTNPALIRVADLDAAIADDLIHYVALGDRHSTTSVGATGRVWYSGAPEPTDYVEVDPGNVLHVTIGDDRTVQVEPIPVATWRFLLHAAELTGADDLTALADTLQAIPAKERTIVKLSLVGQVSLTQKAELDTLLEHHADILAALETWERRTDLVVLPTDDDLGALDLTGFAAAAVADLRALASADTPDADTARDALALLHRLGQSVS